MFAIKRMMNDCLAHLGRSALYQTPKNFEPQVIQVLLQPLDTDYSIGETSMAPTAQIIVKGTDVDIPKIGEAFVIDEITYEIISPPEMDPLSHIWKCLVMMCQ